MATRWQIIHARCLTVEGRHTHWYWTISWLLVSHGRLIVSRVPTWKLFQAAIQRVSWSIQFCICLTIQEWRETRNWNDSLHWRIPWDERKTKSRVVVEVKTLETIQTKRNPVHHLLLPNRHNNRRIMNKESSAANAQQLSQFLASSVDFSVTLFLSGRKWSTYIGKGLSTLSKRQPSQRQAIRSVGRYTRKETRENQNHYHSTRSTYAVSKTQHETIGQANTLLASTAPAGSETTVSSSSLCQEQDDRTDCNYRMAKSHARLQEGNDSETERNERRTQREGDDYCRWRRQEYFWRHQSVLSITAGATLVFSLPSRCSSVGILSSQRQ